MVEMEFVETGVAKQSGQGRLREEVDMAGIVVFLRGHGNHEVPPGHRSEVIQSLFGVFQMLKHFEQGDDIECLSAEIVFSHVALNSVQAFDSTAAHRFIKFGTAGVEIHGRHGQIGKGIETGPQESTAPAADIEKRFRKNALKKAERASNPRHENVKPLETMQAQSLPDSGGDDVRLVFAGEEIKRFSDLFLRQRESGSLQSRPPHERGSEVDKAGEFLWGHGNIFSWKRYAGDG